MDLQFTSIKHSRYNEDDTILCLFLTIESINDNLDFITLVIKFPMQYATMYIKK